MSRPALTVVGTGICCGTDLAANVRSTLLEADEVFLLTSDPISESVLRRLRPDAHSLAELYGHDRDRRDTYAAMVDLVLDRVRAGRRVCFAIPGHPGVFAQPTHEAIRRARAEGFSAVMLPALSAADHLYADLGIDPGEAGSVNFDATDFVLQGRKPDPTAVLILWQIGAIGEIHNPRAVNRPGLRVLADILLETYSPSHEVVVYEAARYAICDPIVLRMPLAALAAADVPLLSTLYVAPAAAAPPLPERLRKLGFVSVPA
jgi:uncharacterized protein YabN with tetrapyrrole methylase and pyrophosphatase domain